MRVNFSILPGVLLAVTCGIAAPAFAQSALERLERQIRQRAAASDSDRSNAAKPVPPPPAVGQVGNPPHGSAYLGIRADDQKDRGRGVRVSRRVSGQPGRQGRTPPARPDHRHRGRPRAADDRHVRYSRQLRTRSSGRLRPAARGETGAGTGDVGRTPGRGRPASGPARGDSAAARRNGWQSPRAAAARHLACRRRIPHRPARAPRSTSSNAAWPNWNANWPRPARRGQHGKIAPRTNAPPLFEGSAIRPRPRLPICFPSHTMRALIGVGGRPRAQHVGNR